MTAKTEGLVTTAGVDEVVAAIEALDLEAPWREVAPNLCIALPRRRALPPGVGGSTRRSSTHRGSVRDLGLDIGPAMLFVGPEQLTGWGVSGRSRLRTGARQHHRSSRRAPSLRTAPRTHRRGARPSPSSRGKAGPRHCCCSLTSSMRVLGERNGLVIAPMRDLILCLPLDTEPDVAADPARGVRGGGHERTRPAGLGPLGW